ncbi:MAG: hypothetical protein AAGJ97_09535, partial [Planctomycetota bacterium]
MSDTPGKPDDSWEDLAEDLFGINLSNDGDAADDLEAELSETADEAADDATPEVDLEEAELGFEFEDSSPPDAPDPADETADVDEPDEVATPVVAAEIDDELGIDLSDFDFDTSDDEPEEIAEAPAPAAVVEDDEEESASRSPRGRGRSGRRGRREEDRPRPDAEDGSRREPSPKESSRPSDDDGYWDGVD